MKILTRHIAFFGLILFPCFLIAQVKSFEDVTTQTQFKGWADQVNKMRVESPDTAIHLYQLSYEYFLEKKDTLNAVNSLVEMAINYGHQVQYQAAYDNLWKALLLADLAQNEEAKIVVYINLGRYYSFYKRKEKALEYFNRALNLKKALVAKGVAQETELFNAYYALTSTYRELNDISKGRIYLDSCFLYENGTSYYLKFESAFFESAAGNHQKALDTLFAIQPWFEDNAAGYQVLLYTYVGDVYLKMENEDKAENFYQKALEISEKYNSHLDFVPTIYERLSNFYKEKGDYKKAYAFLKKEQELDAKFFDSRSGNNRSLLEIKDEFREEKEKQKQFIQEQRIAELEHKKRVDFLENVVLWVTIVFLVFAGVLFFKYIRKKHKVEKALIRKKRELEVKQANELRELEVKQANELLELKNKELATSSLKLIEKDEFLATLKEKLSQGSGDIKANELKKIVRTISHSNAQNWEEFEARFMSVNRDFYQKLNTKYPKLSRGDQKLCALVKLNLSSKEMAKLLGISIESVHTNRYRLRKKLGLEREVSLTEFIAKL